MSIVEALGSVSTRPESVGSVQTAIDGHPRFHIRASPEQAGWMDAVAMERSGGVSAEIRIFLEAQLDDQDVLVDLAPGFGFVALSALTSPGGRPTVWIRDADGRGQPAIVEAAATVGGSVQVFSDAMLSSGELARAVAATLPEPGRVFLHVDEHQLANALHALAPLHAAGSLVLCAISGADAASADDIAAAAALLRARGFHLHELRDRQGEPELFPIAEWQTGGRVLAIADAPPVTASAPVVPSEVTLPTPLPVFSLLAPFCRTGYGVVGAHLVRELAAVSAPVAYFPMGQIDPSMADVPQLSDLLARQGHFDDRAPSVRLSQQNDLALHVGRGPRVGFPIFELDHFLPNERHHLAMQDHLLVTCAWARDIVRANGLTHVSIDIVPLGVDRAVFHEAVPPMPRKAHDTVFMSVGKLERRKGQLELLRAFEEAFRPKDAVQLILVCHNAFVSEQRMAELTAPFRRSPMAKRITLMTTALPTQRDLARVMAAADCAVFPARGEGWNLEALEMLSLGKPVIATNYSAHTAFLTPENARLIDVDALEESAPTAPRGRWAAWGTRQHDQLIAELQAVHHARQGAPLPVNQAGIATATQFSWRAATTALLRSLSTLS